MKTETINKKSSGKLSIEGCSSAAEELTYLQKKARRSLKKCKKLESEHDHVSVRFDEKTTKLIRKEKYLANKQYYDELFKPLN